MRSTTLRRRGRPVDALLRAVRVGPGGVLALGRARRVGDALLAEQQERAGRQSPSWACSTDAQELVLVAGDVHGAGAARSSAFAHGIGPSSAQSTFTVARAVDVAPQRARYQRGKSRHPQRARARHHVGDHGRRRERARRPPAHAGHAAAGAQHALHARAGADLAAEALEVGDERVRQPLGAAARARPADRVPEQVQVEGGDRAARAVRRRVAVHRGAVQPGARRRRRRTAACPGRRPSRAAGA